MAKHLELKVKELREELHARGIFDMDKVKKELQEQLSEVLKGTQRVPTLLLLSPQQALNACTGTIKKANCTPAHS